MSAASRTASPTRATSRLRRRCSTAPARAWTFRSPRWSEAFGERGKLSNDDITADVQATIAYLRSNPDVDADNIGIVGFCFGGMVSYLGSTMEWHQGCCGLLRRRHLAPPGRPRGRVLGCSTTTADAVQAPIIGFWGTEDGGIPVCQRRGDRAGAEGEGASPSRTTSTKARAMASSAPSAAATTRPRPNDSWPKALAFFGAHLK